MKAHHTPLAHEERPLALPGKGKHKCAHRLQEAKFLNKSSKINAMLQCRQSSLLRMSLRQTNHNTLFILVPAMKFQNIVLSVLICVDICNRNVLTKLCESERCILLRKQHFVDSRGQHINTLKWLQQTQDMGTNSCSSVF